MNKKYIYVLWEHPHYFMDYKYNKKRIILHRGSMKYYENYLKKAGFQTKIRKVPSKK